VGSTRPGLAELVLDRLDVDASRRLIELNGAGLSDELKGRILAEAPRRVRTRTRDLL